MFHSPFCLVPSIPHGSTHALKIIEREEKTMLSYFCHDEELGKKLFGWVLEGHVSLCPRRSDSVDVGCHYILPLVILIIIFVVILINTFIIIFIVIVFLLLKCL